MRHFLFALFALAFSTFAFAHEETATSSVKAEQVTPYIDAQSISLSASQFGVGTAGGFYLSPRVEYFVLDRIAIGGAAKLQTNFGNYRYFAFGPSLTDHIFTMGRFSGYLGAALLFNVIREKGDGSTRELQLSVGANYNIRPWFGVGPRLSYVIQKTANKVNFDFINVFFYL